MKVYVRTSGEYSDYHIIRIFKNQADAEAYELGDDIEEWELTENPVEVRTWHVLTWSPNRAEAETGEDRNPWWRSDQREFDGNERSCSHRWDQVPNAPRFTALIVQGWDPVRIRKVYSEQRAQYTALGRVPDQEASDG